MTDQTESTPTAETAPVQNTDNQSSQDNNSLDGILESAIGGKGESLDDRPRHSPQPNTPIGLETESDISNEDNADIAEPLDDNAPESGLEGQDVESSGNPDEETAKGIDAPEHWPNEQKQEFSSLPRHQQEFVLKREKERDAAFTKKTQDLAEQRKSVEALEGVMAPYEQQISASGISKPEYIARLISHDMALRQNPSAAIKNLAQSYGVNLDTSEQAVDWNEPQSDPQYQQLQQQIQQQQNRLAAFEQSAQNERYQSQVEVVTKFQEAKDASGKLLYPHFEKVRERMGRLVNAGETKDIKEAYNMAIRLDPELDKLRIEEERNAVTNAEDQKRKAAVAKAKKAAPSVKTSPVGGKVKSSDLDNILRQSIQTIK
jgi:hypothetical protein